jgi:transposase-like protein
MMSASPVSGSKARRQLSPGEKYEMWMSIVTGQATQREAADRYGVDRSVVVTACQVAKQGALDALDALATSCRAGPASRPRTPRWRRRTSRSSGCGPR